MATSNPTSTNAALATRLLEHADNIMNPAMHEMESDLRLAATALREADEPTPLLPRLVTTLRNAKYACNDPATEDVLEKILGKYTDDE